MVIPSIDIGDPFVGLRFTDMYSPVLEDETDYGDPHAHYDTKSASSVNFERSAT
jgi:hypothetical protein